MIRLGELVERTRRLPVRTRIALVSAALTAVILIGFAAVVGRLVSNRLQNDFENDLQSQANQLAIIVGGQLREKGVVEGVSSMMVSPDSEALLVYADGGFYRGDEPLPRPVPPEPDEIVELGGLDIASALVQISQTSFGPGAPEGQIWVQYARPHAVVGETIGRLWLFLGGGVAIGTLLAGLAGMAVANRSMRPIAALTSTAREIARTRDPSRRVPQPESDDEVAELARTFDEMLRALDAAQTETEGTVKRQREFVADASHELRTPLTSILANLELLHDGLRDDGDDDERAAVGSALRSSKRMNRLIGDLLLLARADAGRAGVQAEADLARIAEEALEEVEPVTEGHHLTPQISGPAPVIGNPDELHRMILNLLENAIRHTPEGTNVRLRVRPVGDAVRLVVADDGPGLPRGMEDQVFERFVRGEGPADRATRNGTGTGLGLSIVRAVAVAHHGDVVADREGGGARFTVTLPLARDRAKRLERTLPLA